MVWGDGKGPNTTNPLHLSISPISPVDASAIYLTSNCRHVLTSNRRHVREATGAAYLTSNWRRVPDQQLPPHT